MQIMKQLRSFTPTEEEEEEDIKDIYEGINLIAATTVH